MLRLRNEISILALALVFFAEDAVLPAQATNEAPDFKEVYGLIAAHVSGVSAADLNRAAVQGLVRALSPKVSLVASGSAEAAHGASLVSQSNLFGGDIAYLRVGRVDEGLAQALRQACQDLGSSDKLKGTVLDLRFTDGQDYAAAAAAADVFVRKEQPLLNWGKGLAQSKEKNDALASPVAVLVNQRTAGAAEALAAVLRETGVGLILGRPTAGEALVAQEFPLSSGGRLRVATAPVQLADGTTLSAGLNPDITVAVSPADERTYYGDAFGLITNGGLGGNAGLSLTNPGAATNHAARRALFNEAELVRERRESLGQSETEGGAADALRAARPVLEARENEPETSVVRDPVLARALDLLKGLAIVHPKHS